ncbi:type 1 fimbrial protein [Enterobacteriaceae bacterium 89]|nr:type 1 fimbrial protein [Enterobacteriaceae bacterium 89]
MNLNRFKLAATALFVAVNFTPTVFASSVLPDRVPSTAASDNSIFGHGKVQVQGSILDAACAISTDSLEQVIDLGLTSTQELYSLGYGPTEKLTINLEHCTNRRRDNSLMWKNISARFIGQVDQYNPKLFALSGDIKGAGIQVQDGQGNILIPGDLVRVGNVVGENTKLVFYIRLAANNSATNDGAGFTTLKLNISYD